MQTWINKRTTYVCQYNEVIPLNKLFPIYMTFIKIKQELFISMCVYALYRLEEITPLTIN